MKKINLNSLEYPVVLRRVLNDMVISVPDLGFWKIVRMEESAKTSKPHEALELSEDWLKSVYEEIKQAWIYIDEHKNHKKWVPEPSTFRKTLQTPQIKDFTLPEFTEALSKHMSISENTVRREIARGTIQCYQTEGGHRRIPYQELELYLDKRNTQREL